jgi:hypothetical protein
VDDGNATLDLGRGLRPDLDVLLDGEEIEPGTDLSLRRGRHCDEDGGERKPSRHLGLE